MVCNENHELRLGMPVTVRLDRSAPAGDLRAHPCGKPAAP